MKKEFTKQEIIDNKGCYDLQQIEKLSFINKDNITLIDILNSEISIKDKRWSLFNKCELTLDNKKELALKMAWCVLPIYEDNHPNDNRIKDCLQAVEDFNNGKITVEVLKEKRYAADAAAATAADAAVSVYNAYAATAAAADAAYAATAADAAATAADVSYKLSYKEKLLIILIDFVNNN